jgi:Zn-dependent peptidase ImmA (M78 family)
MSDRTELLEAAQRAGKLTIEYGFKDRISKDGYTRIDPFVLAEAVELTVLVRPLPKLLGAFLLEDDVPGILLNSERPIGMIRLTCAHELGHYFLGHEPHLDEDIEYSKTAALTERAANEFSYHLLMPRWLIAKVMTRKRWGVKSLFDPVVVYQLSLRLGVSFTAMVWSLNAHRLLSSGDAMRLATIKPIDIKTSLVPEKTALPKEADVWLLDPEDEETILEPRADDRFLLRLPSHAAAGYMWSAQEARQAGFTIKPVLLDPETTPKPEGPVVVGAPASLTYIVEPAAEIVASHRPVSWTLVERQPWNPTSEPAAQLDMRTQFDDLLEGLTPGARRRYSEEVAAR